MTAYDTWKTDPDFEFDDPTPDDPDAVSLLSTLPGEADVDDYLPELVDDGTCWHCEGTGRRGAWIATIGGGRMWGEILCRFCGGTGAERRAAA